MYTNYLVQEVDVERMQGLIVIIYMVAFGQRSRKKFHQLDFIGSLYVTAFPALKLIPFVMTTDRQLPGIQT